MKVVEPTFFHLPVFAFIDGVFSLAFFFGVFFVIPVLHGF
jgi:hypothetical protein